jgi:hypothetical protein
MPNPPPFPDKLIKKPGVCAGLFAYIPQKNGL